MNRYKLHFCLTVSSFLVSAIHVVIGRVELVLVTNTKLHHQNDDPAPSYCRTSGSLQALKLWLNMIKEIIGSNYIISYFNIKYFHLLQTILMCLCFSLVTASSAFNTMQPRLLDKLKSCNASPHIQLQLLDFLADRVQYVKTSRETSSHITINTGGPHDCVLASFLFIGYTNQH